MTETVNMNRAVDDLLESPFFTREIFMILARARDENDGPLTTKQLYAVFSDGVRRLLKRLAPYLRGMSLCFSEDRGADTDSIPARLSHFPVVYVAAPYRSETISGIHANIQYAREAAISYWRRGYAVICPHMNSAFMDGACSDSVFLAGSIELMERADVVVFLDGWLQSEGCQGEHREAERLGMDMRHAWRDLEGIWHEEFMHRRESASVV